MTKSIQLVALLYVLIGAEFSYAGKLNGLYDVTSYVSDRWEKLSDAELIVGMQTVLQRVCGCTRAEVLNLATARDPARYLKGFSLQPTKRVEQDESGNAYLAQALTLSFHADVVEELLRGAKVPLMSPYRPRTLFWTNTGVAGGVEPYQLTLDDIQSYSERIGWSFNALPVNDRFGWLSIQSHWRTLNRFARRYQSDWLVVGDTSSVESSRWAIVRGEQPVWKTFKGDKNQQLSQLMTWLAEESGRLATGKFVQQGRYPLTLVISRVKSLKDHNALIDYLHALPFVTHVKIVSQEQSTLTLSIKSGLNHEQTQFALTVDHHLQAMRLLDQNSQSPVIMLRWIGG
jgi:hypothetical protein